MPAYERVDDAPDRGIDRMLMWRLLQYVQPYRRWVSLAVVCSLLVTIVSVARPFLTRWAFNNYIVPKRLDGLFPLCSGYLALLTLQAALMYGLAYAMAYIGQHIICDLRMRVFRHSIRLNIAHFDRTPVGDMVSRVTNDVNTLNEMFGSGIVMILSDVLVLLFITICMFALNWRLACVAFTILPLLIVVSFFFRIKARVAFRAVRTAVGKINGYMQEHVAGMDLVQLFGRQGKSLDEFGEVNAELRAAHIQTVRYYALYFPVVEFLSAITIGLIVWHGGGQVIRQHIRLGDLVAFIQFTEMFFRPVFSLSDKYNLLQNAMAAAERIFRLLDTSNDIAVAPDAKQIDHSQGDIEFRNVNFAYNPGEPVLKDLNFHVNPGETVAIVGATGAGKTTIISLLSRFYDINEGSILLDGVDIRMIHPESLRRQIATVLQDVFLTRGTIRQNIRLSDESISDDAIECAAEMVGADAFIRHLPNGYDTELTEDGGSLSVGQKQLIAFARALAGRPRILVLDEATSNVDTETEHLIQRAIARMLEERSAIVIAHRLSTIRHADRIAVMHHGELREFGTHKELLAERGIYHRLYQLQYKDQEVDTDA